MNILSVKKKYKSISKLIFKDIPKFAVITGVNGAGKSQFLEMLYYNFYKNKGQSQQNNSIQALLQDCLDISDISLGFDDIIYSPSLFFIGGNSEIDNNNIQSSANQIWRWLIRNNPTHNPNRNSNNQISFPGFITDEGLDEIKKLLKEKGFDPENLSFPQFTDNVNFDFMVHGKMNLEFELSHLFMSYKYMYYDLIISEKLSEEEVLKKLGSKPWDILNNLLIKMKFEYLFVTPEKTKTVSKYKLQLINSKGEMFNVSDLSNGEKVILRLLAWLFTSDNYKKQCKLFLLDEPDAHLHPSQTKMLIDVISETLVKKFDVRVIMTTHSPSTVAMTPAQNLFFMEKEDIENRIKPANKSEAIKTLLYGVRSISIEPENKRQIFTESQVDQFFYEKMQLYLEEHLNKDVVLHFISSGVFDGSVELVKSTVNKLNEAGNSKVFGIIDWDLKNKTEGNVLVPGDGQRYTLENYVFDPLIIGSYLIRNDLLPDDLKDFKKVNHTLLNELDEKSLQDFSYNLEGYLYSLPYSDQREYAESERIGGQRIKVSTEFCKLKGEVILDNLQAKVPSLKKFNVKGQLVKELTLNYLKYNYELLPIEIKNTLIKIQDAN